MSSQTSQTRHGGPRSDTNALKNMQSRTRVVKSQPTRPRWPKNAAFVSSHQVDSG